MTPKNGPAKDGEGGGVDPNQSAFLGRGGGAHRHDEGVGLTTRRKVTENKKHFSTFLLFSRCIYPPFFATPSLKNEVERIMVPKHAFR